MFSTRHAPHCTQGHSLEHTRVSAVPAPVALAKSKRLRMHGVGSLPPRVKLAVNKHCVLSEQDAVAASQLARVLRSCVHTPLAAHLTDLANIRGLTFDDMAEWMVDKHLRHFGKMLAAAMQQAPAALSSTVPGRGNAHTGCNTLFLRAIMIANHPSEVLGEHAGCACDGLTHSTQAAQALLLSFVSLRQSMTGARIKAFTLAWETFQRADRMWQLCETTHSSSGAALG